MTDMMMIGWALVIIGLGLGISILATKKTFGVHPGIIGIVCAALIIGPIAMGWATLPEAEDAGDGTINIINDTGEVQYPTFEITPARSNTTQPAVLKSDETGFTVPYVANTTQHDIYQQDASTSWYDPEIEFHIVPIPFAGASQDDLATIYYEFLEPDYEVEAATSGPYFMFVKTSGKRQLDWHVAGGAVNEWVEGTQTMLMTENVTMQCYMEFDEASLSRAQTAYDAMTIHIKFTNGGSWSETFDVDVIPITISATSTPDVW